MKNFSIVLLDDKPEEVRLLKQLILQDERFHLSGQLTDALKLPDFLSQHPTDVLFTDIQMPGIDGFTTLSRLVYPPRVVFVSSFPDYAVDSFDYQPLYFLTKPLQEEKVLRCLEITANTLNGEKGINPYIFIRINQHRVFQKIYTKEIMYIESAGEYQQFHMQNGEKLLTYKRLKELMQELPDLVFVQIHRSYAINFDYLTSILSDSVVMKDGRELSVSRTKRKALMDNYNLFINQQR